MRRGRIPIIAGLVAAGLALAAPAAARELVYGSWVSPKHGINIFGLAPFFEAVEKETGGAVKWKLLAGGQVVSARSTLPGVRDKLVDAGLVIQVFNRKDLKLSNVIFELVVFGDDPVAVGGAAAETIMLRCPECLAEYKRHKTVYLGALGITPFHLLCKDDLRTVAQLKGKKVRAVGANIRWIKKLGAVPVAIPPTEALTGMQRGSVDCVLAAVAWLRTYGYIDVAKTVIEFSAGMPRGMCVFCMNRSSWDALTDEQKRITWKHLPGVTARSTITGYIKDDAKVKELALERGIRFVKGGDDFKALMAEHRKSERKAVVASMKKLGVRNPEHIMQQFFDAYPKWEKLSAEIGTDEAKFAAVLKREIYDKIDPTKW